MADAVEPEQRCPPSRSASAAGAGSSARPDVSPARPETSPAPTITASTPARSSSATSSRCATRHAGDRELAGRHVEQQAEHVLERVAVVGPVGREQEDLRVDPVERELELVLVAHLDDAVEPEVERLVVQPLEPVVVVLEARDDEQGGVGARRPARRRASRSRTRGSAARSPRARPRTRAADDDPLRAVAPRPGRRPPRSSTSARSEIPSPSEIAWLKRRAPRMRGEMLSAGSPGIVTLPAHPRCRLVRLSPVACRWAGVEGTRLDACYLDADRVPDGLELEEAPRSPTGSGRPASPRTTRFTFSAASRSSSAALAVRAGEVERVDVHVRREHGRELAPVARSAR